MIYLPRFYYDAGAEGGDAGGNEGGAAGGGGNNAPVVAEPLITENELKEFGVENKEQLRVLLNQHKESKVSVEEKQKQEQLKKADFIKFSAENDFLKVEDVSAYESLTAKADRDLAFEKHMEEWKEDNSDVTDPEEIAAQAKADFENKYNLNSENEKQKARGIQRIAKEAAELRGPLTSRYTKAQEAFTERKALEGKVPAFNKAIESLIEKCTPEKLSISKVKYGETEIPIEVELTKKEREELAEAFRTPKMFQKFSNAKDLAEFEAGATKKITGFLRDKYFEAAIGKSFETGKGIGVTKGSDVGAEQPFGIVRNISGPNEKGIKDAQAEVNEDDVRIRKQMNNR